MSDLKLLQNRIRWRARRGHLELDIVLRDMLIKILLKLTKLESELLLEMLNLTDHQLWDACVLRQPSTDFSMLYGILLQKWEVNIV